jgi:hypothetical protein
VTTGGTPAQLCTFRPARLHRIAGNPAAYDPHQAHGAREPSFRTHGSATKRRMISNKSLRLHPEWPFPVVSAISSPSQSNIP